jgi:hypothetical protein
MKPDYTPLIIIGAARSGTNILRDVLTRMPGVGTWPCDEINTIWRHGNARLTTDEFEPENARESVCSTIRRAFDRRARQDDLAIVVEKTCANSLRLAFVDRIFPDARYIYLVRDGRDVAASAMKRWQAPLDPLYIMRKARFVPADDIPYYASRYFWNRLYRLFSGTERLAYWGPRFKDMADTLKQYPLAGVCAMQWKRCLEKSDVDFEHINDTRIYRLSYEQFVSQPAAELRRLAAFMAIELSALQARNLVADVSADNIGKWQLDLTESEQTLVEQLAKSSLQRHGYQ